MQPNIPVVFHLSGKDWASLEAQIRAEFCVNFLLYQVLTQQCIELHNSEWLLFPGESSRCSLFWHKPQTGGVTPCLRFCGTAALGFLAQAEAATVTKRNYQLPKHPQLQDWPFLNTDQLCSSSRCPGLGTNPCEVPMSFRVEIWVCPILLCAPDLFRDLGVWSGRKL